jgi:branched-chain amino acid transport system permease protein
VAVLGGVGTQWGPLISAAILVPLGEITRIQLGGTGKALDLVVYGLPIMIISVIQPGGITALFQHGLRR